jgi:formylglycine-generating enzyme required for sulfatase activity/energy-coupling factor transporter ATP-binding protein EcfA2
VTLDNPYVGLRSFEPHESPLFHGRRTHTQQLLRVLSSHRFVGVVGTSGSGKSSLVKAGLLPALYRGYLRGASSRWKTAVMRPGDTPLLRLAEALCDTNGLALDGPPDKLAQKLAENSAALVDAVRERLEQGQENLLLVVDQFEEVFRSRTESSEGQAYFVGLILRAAEELEVPIYVVLTMRSEFLGECAKHPGLPEALSAAQYLIPQLTREQLAEAIRAPLDVVAVDIEDGLVQRLLNDAGNDPDQLPALQHSLMKLYDTRQAGDGLTLSLYETHLDRLRVGRSLNTHAEQLRLAFEDLPAHRVMAIRLFYSLTTVEQGRAIRRPGKLGDLYAITGANDDEHRDALRAVIRAFAQPENSLLFVSTGQKELSEASWIDITHESLIRQWDWLKTRLQREAERAAGFRRLVEAAQLYREGKKELLGEIDAAYTRGLNAKDDWNAAWGAQYAPSPAFDEAMQFLDLSWRNVEASKEKEKVRVAELARSRTRSRWLNAGLAVAIAGLAFFAFQWRNERQKVDELRQTGAGSQAEVIAELRNEVARLSKSDTGRVKENPKDGLRYVYVERGDFEMGCSPGDNECQDDEKPRHRVTLSKGFWIGQTEVTQAAYERVLKKGNPSQFRGKDRPVEQVSWEEAKDYCKAAGDMRLPTEAEWEYAARARSTDARYGKLDEIAWYNANSGSGTQPVATKLPNQWGLYDMLGNVWEWTADGYESGDYHRSSNVDPMGPGAAALLKRLRGGAWNVDPRTVRVSFRFILGPRERSNVIGFRCAGELP